MDIALWIAATQLTELWNWRPNKKEDSLATIMEMCMARWFWRNNSLGNLQDRRAPQRPDLAARRSLRLNVKNS